MIATVKALARQQIIDLLRETLSALPAVRAAWLGGSDASGRTDRYSDIDIQALVADEAVAIVFTAVTNALATLAPIDRQYRLPEPTWHGHSQTLYRLQNVPPWLLVDLVLMKESSPPEKRFLEMERHGRQVILFDREGVIQPPPFDRESHQAAMRDRLADLVARFDLFHSFVDKVIRRGDVVEATTIYQGQTIRPLIELLRMRYCPDRYDFGPRYLDRDLPADIHEQLKQLMLYRDLDELQRHQAAAVALFWQVHDEIQRDGL